MTLVHCAPPAPSLNSSCPVRCRRGAVWPRKRAVPETLCHTLGLDTLTLGADERTFASSGDPLRGKSEATRMSYKRISIKHGGVPADGGDCRCKRAASIYPSPLITFDLNGRRINIAWSWIDVQVVDVPNGVRVEVVPALLLVPIARN
jgi:hypothetical protein